MRRNAFRRHRWACIAAAAAFSISLRAVDYYVSPDGNDAWSGLRNEQTAVGEDGPFATLARVRDAIRERKAAGALTGPVTVHVRHGIYPLRDTLELTEADSGTPEAPITYRGPRKSRARISGGRAVEKWHRVEEPGVLRRLRAPARAHVLQADLKALGIDSFGDMVSAAKWAQSRPGLEVFFEDAPMTLARWPNTGMAKIAGFPTGAKRKVLWGKTRPNTSVEPAFHYDGEHQASWLGEPAIMLHGYWFWDWADQRYRVASIDPATKTIHLDREHHYGLRK